MLKEIFGDMLQNMGFFTFKVPTCVYPYKNYLLDSKHKNASCIENQYCKSSCNCVYVLYMECENICIDCWLIEHVDFGTLYMKSDFAIKHWYKAEFIILLLLNDPKCIWLLEMNFILKTGESIGPESLLA